MSKKINIICFFCPLFFLFFCHFFLFLQYILLVILLCSFNDVKLERRPQALVLMLIVHFLFSVCFGCALLWNRCCKKKKKKKRKPRSKATDRTSVWIFWYFIVFVPVSGKSFLWRETEQDSQKSPINILVQKEFVCPTPSSQSSSSLLGKKRASLVWLNQDSLQQDECGFNVRSQSVKQSDRGHSKAAKSENSLKQQFSGCFLNNLPPH